MMVTGPANRTLLAQKILDFCGVFPIYNVEKLDKRSLIDETIGEWIKFSYAFISFTEKKVLKGQIHSVQKHVWCSYMYIATHNFSGQLASHILPSVEFPSTRGRTEISSSGDRGKGKR